MSDEIEAIRQRYRVREQSAPAENERYIRDVINEREKIYSEIILSHFVEAGNLSVLEIGAGAGANIPFFLSLGIRREMIFANELLEDRLEGLRSISGINILPGNAMDILEGKCFNIVFQSTVFSSILDNDFRKKLAVHLWKLVCPGGIFLSYDLRFNNPSNSDVRKVTPGELKKYFREAAYYSFHKTTLAPPLGRRFASLYKFLNLFPFLRSHCIAVFKKQPVT